MPGAFPHMGCCTKCTVKTTSQGKNNSLGVKCKVDDVKLDKPDAPDVMKNKFDSKRAKKIEVKQSTYI